MNHKEPDNTSPVGAGKFLSACFLSVFLTGLVGAILSVLSTNVIGIYGSVLFMLLPALQGFLATLLAGVRQPISYLQSFYLTLGTIGMTGFLIFITAFEGLICLVMALPLALPLATIGGGLAVVMLKRIRRPKQLYCATVLLIPALLVIEEGQLGEPPIQTISTEILIEATPEEVWQEVTAFSEIPPPTEWIFSTGIAYPIRAEIHGTGTGAVRHCVFSTGSFIEPITVWDEPRLLRFDVTEQPVPMVELSPHSHVHAPHLDDYLKSHQGQFKLTALANGQTKLAGTTWYSNRMWPQAYWTLITDHIIQSIHERVLQHIKEKVEAR